jgi:hypothetical protein
VLSRSGVARFAGCGHRLQLRLTSTDLPTHLPGSIAFDRNDPAATQINLFSPRTNTVKLGKSYLLVPVEPAKRRRR